MAGSIRSVVLALCVVVTVTSSANAFWGRLGWRPVCTTAYTPAPVWYYCLPAAAPSWGQPVLPQSFPPPPAPLPKVKALANPLPAPTTNEPPLRAPTITEARSFGGVMQAHAAAVAPGRCKVGFWNITGGEVTLSIDGTARTLAKDRAVTLELARMFVWQLSGHGPQTERVPDGQSIFEVILRP